MGEQENPQRLAAEAYADRVMAAYAELVGSAEAVKLLVAMAWLEGAESGSSEVRRMILDRLAVLGEHSV